MSDTPRTDNAICVRRWTERQGECAHVPCEQQYVEPDFARELERELARVTAERDALRPAARLGLLVLREARDDLADIDGGWLQEVAEKYGLLHTVTMTEPCGEHCRCAEYDDEWPTACLRMTPETLKLEQEFADD